MKPFDSALPALPDSPVETFGFQWAGKAQARRAAEEKPATRLAYCEEQSLNGNDSGNIFIEGDNLEALRHLQETHAGRVKVIYIDPPYNTGGDLIYRDNLRAAGSAPHSGWLNMLLPRLILAWRLLREDGVIFISIDDSEAAYLKVLCDEVFGEENHRVTHYVQVRYPGKTLSEKSCYQKLVEQVLVYGKPKHRPICPVEPYPLDKFCWKISELEPGKIETVGGRTIEIFRPGQWTIGRAESSLDALKETWASGSVLKVNASGRYFGTHLAPRRNVDGINILYKVHGIGEDGLGYRYFTGPKRVGATKGKFYSGVPLARREEFAAGGCIRARPIPNLLDFADAFGNCRHEGGVDFRGGKKPVAFLRALIAQASDDNDIVLDFFAGSASTAQAVLEMNLADGQKRAFILVQSPEPVNRLDADVAAEFATISELALERIRRTARKLSERNPGGVVDFGFRLLRIEAKN